MCSQCAKVRKLLEKRLGGLKPWQQKMVECAHLKTGFWGGGVGNHKQRAEKFRKAFFLANRDIQNLERLERLARFKKLSLKERRDLNSLQKRLKGSLSSPNPKEVVGVGSDLMPLEQLKQSRSKNPLL